MNPSKFRARALSGLALLLAITSSAQDLVIDPATGAIDETVDVVIRIESAPNAATAFGFDILYDASALEFIEFVRGELVIEFALFDVHPVEPGRLRLGGVCTLPDDEIPIGEGTSGELVALQFTVTACAEAPSIVSITDLVDDVLGWEIAAGEVTCGEPALMVSDTLLRVGAGSGEASFEVQNIGGGALEWEIAIELGAAWLSVTPVSGTGDAEIAVTHESNPSTSQRGGRIRVEAGGASPDSVTIEVLQSGRSNMPPTSDGCAASAESVGTSHTELGDVGLLLMASLWFVTISRTRPRRH